MVFSIYPRKSGYESFWRRLFQREERNGKLPIIAGALCMKSGFFTKKSPLFLG